MTTERKSRYEQWIEEEKPQAKPRKRPEYKKKYKSREDRFWKTYWTRVERVGDCFEWTGMYKGYRKSVPYGKWDRKQINIRRLVYRLAIGDLPDDVFVVVSCKNRRCVRQSHLLRVTAEEYDTIKCNSVVMSFDNTLRGGRVGTAKLTNELVRCIRARVQLGERRLSVARELGISPSTVGDVVNGRRWGHVE